MILSISEIGWNKEYLHLVEIRMQWERISKRTKTCTQVSFYISTGSCDDKRVFCGMQLPTQWLHLELNSPSKLTYSEAREPGTCIAVVSSHWPWATLCDGAQFWMRYVLPGRGADVNS